MTGLQGITRSNIARRLLAKKSLHRVDKDSQDSAYKRTLNVWDLVRFLLVHLFCCNL